MATSTPKCRRYKTGQTVSLHLLEGQVLEFNLQLRNSDPDAPSSLALHTHFCARVRLVPASPAIWLNDICIHDIDHPATKEADGSWTIRF